MGRPRKAEGRDTRRDILDRSLDLFAEQGFAGTSMREIARAVGVRESALYHHFPSKDAVLEGLLRELGPGRAMQILQVDVPALVAAVGAERFLRNFVELLLTIWASPQERKIVRIMMGEGGRRPLSDPMHPAMLMTRIREAAAGIFRHLVEARCIAAVDPATAALAFMGPLVLLRFTYLTDPNLTPDYVGLRAQAKQHVDFFWAAIKPVAPRAARNRVNVRSGKGAR